MFSFTNYVNYVNINMIYFNMVFMYSNRNLNFFSLVITCIIFFLINYLPFNFPENKTEEVYKFISNIKIIKKNQDNNINNDEIDLGDWYLEIPSINLKAPIAEGTDNNTLNTKVGHFTETSLIDGNIGLAAHNRGYEYNFFKDLKNIKVDDKIIYNYLDIRKIYLVDKIEIIENTDWSYLNNTEKNKITLITCIENQPNYRRCVQAIEL